MNAKDLVAMPYRLARVPVAVVDFKLVQRLPDDSRARLVFERAVGSADRLAGRLLRDDSLARLGTGRVERVDKLAQAADLEEKAKARLEVASAEKVEARSRRRDDRLGALADAKQAVRKRPV